MTAERTREVPPEAVLPTAVLCGSRLPSGTGGLASSVCLGETGREIGRREGFQEASGLAEDPLGRGGGKKVKRKRRALMSGSLRTMARAQAPVRSANGRAPQKKMG